MQAYHNDPAVKDKYLSRVKAHREADELIRGTGWADGKGCSVGCTFEAYDHSRGPVEIGFPEILMRLNDVVFEGLPEDKAQLWPERFLQAAAPGADLSRVSDYFMVWLLREELKGRGQDRICSRVAVLYERRIAGDEPALKEWESAWSAWSAWSAAWSAWSAAESARSAAYERMADKLVSLLGAAV